MTAVSSYHTSDALFKFAMDRLAPYSKPIEKEAFLPATDPAMMGSDPAMGGGDPAAAAAGGMPADPAAAGGAPAAPAPSGGGGGGALDEQRLASIVTQAVTAAMGAMGGAGGGGAGGAGAKPYKVDQDMEMHKLVQINSAIAEALGVKVPITALTSVPGDGTPIGPAANQQQSGMAAQGGGASQIQPIQPMPAAAGGGEAGGQKAAGERSVLDEGEPYRAPGSRSLYKNVDKATAILSLFDTMPDR